MMAVAAGAVAGITLADRLQDTQPTSLARSLARIAA